MKHRLLKSLTLLMALGAVSTSAEAQTESGVSVTIGYVNYYIINDEAKVSSFENVSTFPAELEIPQSVEYNGTSYPVTTISNNCAHYSTPKNLRKLVLPEGLKTIGSHVFIGGNNLTEVVLPSTLTEIGLYAFESTGVSSLKLPASLVSIGHGAFSDCQNLSEITVEAGNPYYYVTSGVLFEEKSSYQGRTLVLYPAGLNRSKYTIDSEVEYIHDYAFYGCKKLRNVDFATSKLVRIGDWTFAECSNLQTIKISEGVESIWMNAFWGCEQLISVSLPSTLTWLSDRVFFGCASLSSITLPSSLERIGSGVFGGCESLQKINVEPGSNFFASIDGVLYNKDITELIKFPEGSSLSEYTLPETVTELPNGAFSSCKLLKQVNLHQGISAISNYAFMDSGIKYVTLPESVLSIGDGAFNGCKSLHDFYAPESVVTIGEQAFAGSNLQGIALGSRVRNIGENVFADCNSLMAVTTLSKDIKPGLKTLSGCTRLADGRAKLFVTDGDCADLFKSDESFAGFDIRTIPTYSISAGDNGSVTVNNPAGAPEPYPFMYSEIKAEPAEGYVFENWTSNAEHLNNSKESLLNMAMPLEDLDLKANFTSMSSVTEIAETGIEIRPVAGGIEVAGAEIIKIYTISGVCVYSGPSAVVSDLNAGLYIVDADGIRRKIAVGI